MVAAKAVLGRRVLDDGGPLVVGGEQKNGAWRGGVTVSTSACNNPRCRTVFLTGALVRDRRAEPARDPDLVRDSRLRRPSPDEYRFSALFDIDTGRIKADPEAPPDPDDEEVRGLLDHEVSEAVQTVLRRRWRQAKGLEDRDSWRDRDWSWWEPGNLVSHCMVFPDHRDFLFTQGGTTFWAEDSYCVNARCACRRVLLEICDISGKRGVSVGTVEVDYVTSRILEVSPERVSKSRLRGIWKALEEQLEPWDEFRERHEEMKAFGDELVKLVSAERDRSRTSSREDAGDVSGSESTASLSCEEILERLTSIERPFPRDVVQAAVEKREEITPRLLQILEDTIARAEQLRRDKSYFAHMYALHLLAQFRERRAYPLAIRLAYLPEETMEDLFGDFSSDGFHQILGSVAHGEPGPALELAADRSASQWIRIGAAQSLLVMIVAGDLERSEAIACYREMLRRIIRDARKNDRECIEFCSAVVDSVRALRPEELMEEVAELYELDLVDEYWVSRTSVERALEGSVEAAREDLEYWNSPIVDTVQELETWGCFTEDVEPSAPDLESPSALLKRPPRNEPSPSTIVREGPKVGRNDPCPCGSGKKYKRCCLKRA